MKCKSLKINNRLKLFIIPLVFFASVLSFSFASAEVGFSFQKNLVPFDQSEDVVRLQEVLISEGLYCEGCQVTGDFEYQTLFGLMSLQEKYGLPMTGVTDQETRVKLNQLIGYEDPKLKLEAEIAELKAKIVEVQATIAELQEQLALLKTEEELENQVSPAVDIAPTSAITNLAILNRTASSIQLSWTAPASTGTEASYDIRYTTTTPQLVGDSNWATAVKVIGEPAVQVVGTSQLMTVSGLKKDTYYYFAIKTIDEAQNESTISNIASATTLIAGSSGGGGGGGNQVSSANPVSPAPAPPAPVAQCGFVAYGKRTYFVSTKNMPQFMQVDFDPLNVAAGYAQIITVKIRDTNSNPITSVSATITIDEGVKNVSFALISGTTANGTWQATWSPASKICTTYTVKLQATSASGTSSVDASIL